MSAREVDVLILGGGINGAGLFRDLCEQGIAAVLVDKGDFGSGTSAAPSRLIHGGLKYLETGEFRLVRESAYERNLLLRNAAHLVKPLPTLVPLFSWMKGVAPALRTFLGTKATARSRGAVLVKVGLTLYDRFGARARVMPRHRMLSRRAARAAIPALTGRIVAAGLYHDAAVTAPERLVLELVLDGLAACPEARALNWTRLVEATGGELRFEGPEGETLLRPRIVVNAAGPWIDRVNAALGTPTAFIGGTKGSHLLLDHAELVAQLNGRMIYFEADDGRILLVYPYHGRALVGTTDIPAGDPDTVCCEPGEVAYLLESLRRLLPGIEVREEQIVYAYAGIRPLPNSAGVAPGLISRDHSVPVLEPTAERSYPVLSLVGGKWTTFRAFAEEVADDLLGRLGRPRQRSTADLPIGGGLEFPTTDAERRAWVESARRTRLPAARLEQLLDRYGSRGEAIAEAESRDPSSHVSEILRGSVPQAGGGGAPSPAGQPALDPTDAEIAWIARNEMVRHLEDIVLRRTQLAVTGRLDGATLERVARVAGEALGWPEERRAEEVAAVRALLKDRHGVTL